MAAMAKFRRPAPTAPQPPPCPPEVAPGAAAGEGGLRGQNKKSHPRIMLPKVMGLPGIKRAIVYTGRNRATNPSPTLQKGGQKAN